MIYRKSFSLSKFALSLNFYGCIKNVFKKVQDSAQKPQRLKPNL